MNTFKNNNLAEHKPKTINNERYKMDSILINNITKGDVKTKMIRVTVENKQLFPTEILGDPQKHNLVFNYDNKKFNATYTIGSKDFKSRSGVLKIGSELYFDKLHICKGTTLMITKNYSHNYKIEKVIS